MNGQNFSNAVSAHFGSENVRHLGAGTFGITYRVELADGRIFATKVFRPQFTMARNEREIEYLGLVKSPHVVGFVDEGTMLDNGTRLRYVCTDFIDGITLREKLATGTLSQRELTTLAKQVGRGLHALHEAHLTHRDLKPENILISHTGRFVIIDLGGAKREGAASLTIAGEFIGTLAYASLEQLQDAKHVDIRADLFSLGSTLFEAAHGNMTFPYHDGTERDRLQFASNIRTRSIKEFNAWGLTDPIKSLLAPLAFQRPATPAMFLASIGAP